MIASFFVSCGDHKRNVKIQNFKNGNWTAEKVLQFQFSNNLKKNQTDFLYQVAYTESFPVQNIWLKYALKDPNGKILITSKDNLDLFNKVTGRPLGVVGAQKIYSRAYFLKGILLEDTGSYTLSVQHYLRMDTLGGIQALGVEMRQNLK